MRAASAPMLAPMLALVLALMLAGCVQPAALDARAAWCAVERPRDFSAAELDALPPRLKRVELVRQLNGEAWCGWQP